MKWNETGVSGSVSLRTTWGTESRLHVSPADMLQDHLNAVSTACFMSLNQTECRRLSDGRLGEIFRWNINIFVFCALSAGNYSLKACSHTPTCERICLQHQLPLVCHLFFHQLVGFQLQCRSACRFGALCARGTVLCEGYNRLVLILVLS